MVLGIGGCSFVVFRTFKGPIDRANEFLAAVDAGDYAGAASMASTDPRCFGETAERDLAAFFGPVDIAEYDLTSVDVSTGGGDSVSDVSGTITISGSPSTSINVNLLKVDGDWEICGVQVDP